MLPWTRAEGRWRDALLEAALPGRPVRLNEAAWAAWRAAAPPALAWGLRASVWLLTWWPLLTHGRPLHRLPPEAADASLAAWAASPRFLPRQVVLVTRLVAGTAAAAAASR